MKVATKLRLILPFSSVTHLSLIRRWYLKTMRRAPLIALLFAALTIGGAAGSERARSARHGGRVERRPDRVGGTQVRGADPGEVTGRQHQPSGPRRRHRLRSHPRRA